ncbi:hypothetical protein AYR62_11975 [Secundilactobacillus paracollinoides]|uniref:MBG domain-containing protein n=1 Tax=Secundilactobacillus paracollinoides TaxID=240427 RepID=UPI00081A4D27|nr:MBG domain-containing protein [Secundilactobacillus paracollinoides]ANZ64724.1 hypothetical protein AYR62_11975 [Secundilactobacillus paracollinoides]
MVGKNNRSKEVQSNLQQHYKAYKSGKRWVFASIASLSLGMALFFGAGVTSYADSTSTSTADTTATATSSANQSSQSSSDTTSESTTADSDAASTTSTTTTDDATTASSSNDATSATSSSDASTQSTDAATASSTTAATAQTEAATASSDDSTSTDPASDATTTNENTDNSSTQTNTASNSNSTSSDTASTDTSTDVKTTDLGSTDNDTLNAAKTAAAADYATTGQAQKIVASSAAQTAEIDATVGTTTKTYDNDASTPLNFTVTLANGVNAPSEWYATDTANEYYVASDSGNLDIDTTDQNVGTYAVTLSTTGLANLQAVNIGKTITTDNIVAGSLVISKVEAASNSIVIAGDNKNYDNDASTNPTSYVVTLGSDLVAPESWTANTDGTYTVDLSTNDIDADITSQQPGSYEITLSAQGIADLEAVNTNYTIPTTAVRSGWFNIVKNDQAVVGSISMNKGTSLPSGLYVTINNAGSYQVPTDWTASYTNAAQSSIVYTVPMSYFDTSAVNTSTDGQYTIKLSDATISSLNASNASLQLTANNVSDGTVTVHDATSTSTEFTPANMYTTISNTSAVYSSGSLLNLNLRILNNNTVANLDNLTEYLVVPAGFVIGETDSTGNAVVASDPASTITSEITQSLTDYNVAYTGLSVTQETSYKDRQVFKISFDSVTTFNGSVTLDNLFPVTIVTDPNSTVTSGYIGPNTSAPDSGALYITDNFADTQGDYAVDGYGAYVNVPEIANALGIDDAYILNSTYTNYIYQYGIVQAQVQDTYNFVGPDGVSLGSKTIIGTPQTTYNTLSLVPTTIVQNGITYELKDGAVATYATYPAITTTVSDAATVATGNTYTVQYLQVMDTTQAAGAITDQTMSWTGSTPTSYTVTLPTGLTAPTGWTANGDGTYTIATTSGDLNVSAVSPNVGSYDVSLSATGLAKLAAANQDYLFDSNVIAPGTVTVKAGQSNYTVTITDTAGNSLQPTITENYTWPDGTSVDGVNVAVNGYTADELQQVVATANTNSPYNTEGITKITFTNNGDGTTTATFLNTDSSKDTSSTVSAPITALMAEFGIGVGSTPQLTDQMKQQMAQFTNIDVIYNTQAASATVSYVDQDDNNAVISTDTAGTYVGENGNYIITIPAGYALSDDQTATILSQDGINAVAYKVTADDSDDLTINLVHKLDYGTATSTRTITYQLADGDASKTPASTTQTFNWNTVTDEATHETYATISGNTTYVVSPEVAGYTANLTTVGTVPTQASVALTDIAKVTPDVTVTYTANKQTADLVYVDDDASDNAVVKTDQLTGTTDATTTWTATIPAGYELASDQAASGSYTFAASDNPDVTIHLVHSHTLTQNAATTTDTISTTGLATGDTTTSYTVNWDSDTDNVTKTTTYTPTSDEPATYTPAAVAGYTVTPGSIDLTKTATTDTPTDNTYTVTYTADAQAVIVNFVDDKGNTLATTTINGQTDAAVDYSSAVSQEQALINMGYTPKAGTTNTLTSAATTFDNVADPAGSASQVYTVTLVKNSNVKVTATIVPVDDNGNTIPNTTSTTVSNYPGTSVDVPTVQGYTATVSTVTIPAEKTPTIKVTYTANAQQVVVNFVDDKGNDLASTTIDGVSNGTIDYSSAVAQEQALLNQGYTPQSGSLNTLTNAAKTFDTNDGVNQTYTVTLAKVAPVKVTTTISVVDQNGNAIPGASDVTTTSYPGDAISVPEIAGYTPETTTVATPATKNGKITVTYTANVQSFDVTYVDDVTGQQVGVTETVTGVTNEDGTYTVTVPANYVLAKNQDGQIAYTFTADGAANQTVHLAHKIVDGTTTTTRTINYVYADGTQAAAPVTQTMNWKTVSDLVTGTSYATAQNGYDAVVTPDLTGYTADKASVAQELLGNIATADLADSTVTVVYTANPTNPDNGNGGSTTDPTNPDNGNGGTTTPGNNGNDVATNPGDAVVVPNDGDNASGSNQTSNGTGTTGNDVHTTTNQVVTGTDNHQTGQPTGNNGQSTGLTDVATTTGNATASATNSQVGAADATTGSAVTGKDAAKQQATGKLPQTNESQSGAWAIAGASLLGLLGLVGFGKKRKED